MPSVDTHAVTPEELEAFADVLDDCSERLRAFAEVMRKRKVKEIQVTHERQKKDSLRFIRNFTAATDSAMLDLKGPKYD